MPRITFSTLRAEIKDGGPSGTSTAVSSESTVSEGPVVSSAETSLPELLTATATLRGHFLASGSFEKHEARLPPLLLLLALEDVDEQKWGAVVAAAAAVVADAAILLDVCLGDFQALRGWFIRSFYA